VEDWRLTRHIGNQAPPSSEGGASFLPRLGYDERMRKLLVLGALLLAPATPTHAFQTDGPRRSLEEMLAAERTAAAAKLDALRPEVSSLLSSLRSLAASKSGDNRVALLRAQLIELGPTITPLLVQVINPKDDAQSLDLRLALHVATVLKALPLEAVLDELVAIAQTGSPAGRSLAVRILGASGEPARVGPLLANLYHDNNALRLPALRSLCQLGGPDAEAVLAEVLASADSLSQETKKDRELITEAVAALADTIRKVQAVTPGQLAFLRTVIESRAARDLIVPLIDFASALPQNTFSPEDTERFIKLASDRLVSKDDRIRLLNAIPDLGLVFERGMDKQFEEVLDETNPKLVEAALVCLARFGDKGAKKDLMKPYKEQVADKRNDPVGYEARGGILTRLHEYDAAVIDYKKAIKLYADKKKSPYASNAAYTGMARALCLAGDIRAASKALDDSSLSTVQLRNLAKDPDFAALVADEKYNRVLRL